MSHRCGQMRWQVLNRPRLIPMWQLFLAISDWYLVGMGTWLVLLAITPKLLLRLRRRWKGQPRKQSVVKGGLAAWFVVGLFTVFELGFALFYDTSDSFDMTNVSHRWFQVHVQPDMKTLKFEDGTGIEYRDDRVFTEPTPGRHMLFLGDSFTFGHGVPDVRHRFSNRLRAKLETDGTLFQNRFPYFVSNLSKPGSDLVWGNAVLKQLVRQPPHVDMVAYVMCLNDIEAFHPQFMEFNNQVGAMRSPPSFFLVRDTYFFNWAYYRGLMLMRSDVRNYYDFVKDYYAGPPWQGFVEQLSEMKVCCDDNDIDFCLVIFPFLHNLQRDYPFEAIHRQIAEGCQRLDVRCVDLLPALQAHASEGLTVNPFDAHPNERAHDIVANYLRQKLPDFDTQETAR